MSPTVLFRGFFKTSRGEPLVYVSVTMDRAPDPDLEPSFTDEYGTPWINLTMTVDDFVRRYGPLRPHVEALLSYLEQEVSGARPDDPLP